MKSIRLFVVAAAVLLVSSEMLRAREVRPWSYQELLEKSDFVVIATPSATKETKEHIDLPGFTAQPVVGVETEFAIAAVLKGDKALKDLVLHHYRADGLILPNGPILVSFDLTHKKTFLLFLVRESDGRYAPAFGQKYPGLCGIDVIERHAEP